MTVNVFNSSASSELEKMNNYLDHVHGFVCISSTNRLTLSVLRKFVAKQE
jgi:hypothetical protein